MLVERDIIGIFGKMNAGKSSVMNLITQQETSIVDPTPGTTADTKATLMEIHGLGPVKIYDTAGADEESGLGEKKRAKVFEDLKECDLVLLVIDPSTSGFSAESHLLEAAREADKQILILFNIFGKKGAGLEAGVSKALPLIRFYRQISLDATEPKFRQPLLDFIIRNYEPKNVKIALMPFLEKGKYYLLNIPMDDETPPGRYLRPQAMCEEYITRNWAYPVSFRMDLAKARSADGSAGERRRFLDVLSGMKDQPRCVVTDSQAIDIISKWVPQDIMITTFSIMMINYFSRGGLRRFVEGTGAIGSLKAGDRVLIVEACNHSRIGEDIGTVQIPRIFQKRFPGVVIEHNFGREFQENKELERYKLIIHCGGCMISSQKLQARMRDLVAVGVPFTNYGVFLSYVQGKGVLDRVLEPWGLKGVVR